MLQGPNRLPIASQLVKFHQSSLTSISMFTICNCSNLHKFHRSNLSHPISETSCHLTKPSESSRSLPRSSSRIVPFPNGSVCAPTTRSDTTPRDVTGDAQSSSCKRLQLVICAHAPPSPCDSKQKHQNAFAPWSWPPSC